MENFSGVCKEEEQMDLPPGFRFHPTDEELISHYLYKKVIETSFSARAIGEVDLNKSEPWELPCKFAKKNFFSLPFCNFFPCVSQFLFVRIARTLVVYLDQILILILFFVWMKGKRKWERKSGTFSV